VQQGRLLHWDVVNVRLFGAMYCVHTRICGGSVGVILPGYVSVFHKASRSSGEARLYIVCTTLDMNVIKIATFASVGLMIGK
jgi:hypothetical protein